MGLLIALIGKPVFDLRNYESDVLVKKFTIVSKNGCIRQ